MSFSTEDTSGDLGPVYPTLEGLKKPTHFHSKKMRQSFSLATLHQKKFESATIASHIGLVFGENLGEEITSVSRHRFRKAMWRPFYEARLDVEIFVELSSYFLQGTLLSAS